MLINHEQEFICILPAHTASFSCYNMLLELFPETEKVEPHHGVVPELIEKHSSYFTFATIRNPFNRMRTAYFHRTNLEHARRYARGLPQPERSRYLTRTKEAIEAGFCDFVANLSDDVTPYCEIFEDVRLDYLIRQRNFIKDFRGLPLPGVGSVEEKRQHVHPRVHVEKTYELCPEAVDIMLDRYSEDFDRFYPDDRTPF